MDRADKPLALTLGEPAGIGPDITLLAFAARRALAIPPFVLIGDTGGLAGRAGMMDLAIRIEPIGDASAAPSVFSEALPVLPVPLAGEVVAGRPSAAAAASVQQSIEQAVALVRDGAASA